MTAALDIAFYYARRPVKDCAETAPGIGNDAPLLLWVKGEDGTLARAKSDHLTLRKRSVLVDGQRTSISIQDGLWVEFKAIAEQRGVQLRELLFEIEAKRKSGSLSAAVRRFIYLHLIHASSPSIAADDFDAR